MSPQCVCPGEVVKQSSSQRVDVAPLSGLVYGLIRSRARRREQLPRVAAAAPQRPQRERVLAAAVEAYHVLGLRKVPLEREARVLAAQGQRERIFGGGVVAVGARAVRVLQLNERLRQGLPANLVS